MCSSSGSRGTFCFVFASWVGLLGSRLGEYIGCFELGSRGHSASLTLGKWARLICGFTFGWVFLGWVSG